MFFNNPMKLDRNNVKYNNNITTKLLVFASTS